ncbi:MAG: hypothetical protein GY720_20800 [bacterium]|nr:hypothetical protein [bacterium]
MMNRVLMKAMGAVAAAAAAYHFLIRPRILRRGATYEESMRPLPGDEITPLNPFRSTMATTIEATPEEVWPWLVQVGWERAAFYSYNRIEAALGMDLHNADEIKALWQNLEIGDTMWMSHPRLKDLFPETKVATIEPYRALVFAIHGPEGTDAPPSGAWSFILDPIDATSTRLIARLQVRSSSLVGKLVFYGFMEPAHFIMQDGMFRGLKKRIPEAAAADGGKPDLAAVDVG